MKAKGRTISVVLLLAVSGCGVMGPPVPPDTIGVNAKRRNDKVEADRRLAETKKQGPEAQPQVAPSLLEGAPLQGEVVQPAARPDSDFLVRPR